MRFFAVLSLFCLIAAFTATPALAAGNPRYASLIMDADSGVVLHQENSRAQRFPASLTKMMTLYMLFDELRAGRMTMKTMLPVSAKAAAQPQTNISLKAGDRISVENAIKALVVRSANDVAVVVAEAIGRSEWNFGLLMSAKAHTLGMRSTVFRNASGLPDARQRTTAYDMAVLGIALQKKFPQYYPYFKTSRFVWKGRTYTGHNHVMNRYGGVDGIKTGYINASGFNLVTSVKKDGRNLVAVVMGGRTAKSRDDHMIALLDRTYTKLAANKGKETRVLASAPVPQPNPLRIGEAKPVETAARPVEKPAEIQLASLEKPVITFSMPKETPQKPVAPKAPEFSVTYTPVSASAALAAGEKPAAGEDKPLSPHTLDYQLAKAHPQSTPAATTSPRGKNWGIQVGAFNDERQARTALKEAFQIVEPDVRDAYVTIQSQGAAIHRARLGNLTREEAKSACQKLVANNGSCFALKIN